MQIIVRKILAIALCAGMATAWLTAQNSALSFREIPLQNLQAFTAADWRLVGTVSGRFDHDHFTTTPGTGIVTSPANGAQPLKTNLTHGDAALELDFMLTPGATASVILQDQYAIELNDSWHNDAARTTWCGTLPGGATPFPRYNAAFAPGLWQHLSVEFQAARFDAAGAVVQPARVVSLKINGLLLYEQVTLKPMPGVPARATGPLVLRHNGGGVFFRQIRYALLDDLPARLTDLSYEYFERPNAKAEKADKLIRAGKTPLVDTRLADIKTNFLLKFTGTLKVDKAADYRWILRRNSMGSLKINDKMVIPLNWKGVFDTSSAVVALPVGEHRFELVYDQRSSGAAALGLTLIAPNTRPLLLHAPPSLPAVIAAPLMALETPAQPRVIRGFYEYNGKKLTQTIAVGDPSGAHFMYDLDGPGPLTVWKGDFLNVAEMWYARGEPQTMEPLGATLQLVRTPLADSIYALRYAGYQLDKQGRPTFRYKGTGWGVEDALTGAGRGLERRLTIRRESAAAPASICLVETNRIDALGDGLYGIDQRYFIKMSPDSAALVTLRPVGARQQLTVNVTDRFPEPAVIVYEIIF